MFDFSNPWIPWILGGAGILVVIISGVLPYLKTLLPSFKPAKPDPVANFTALKDHCKDCPEACEALKVVWRHLEPGCAYPANGSHNGKGLGK